MTRRTDRSDVLEQNVSTLLESGGEAPKLDAGSRARIRTELIARHGVAERVKTRVRVPRLAIGVGLAAAAVAALIVMRFVAGGGSAGPGAHTLADGTTYIAKDGAHLAVLGPRRVRVEGEVLLDVARGPGRFVVETARGTIEVLGTRFLVDAEPARTLTAVVRGEVKLATDQGSVVVHAGEQAVAEPGRPPTRGPAPRLSHLVSWAKAARRRAEGSLEPARHGTLFARDPGVRHGHRSADEYPLPLKQLTLDVVVEDQVARVALDQTFHNPQGRVLEGVYKFAIPPDAALQRLAMYVGGKLTESAVVERMRARRIYEQLVYREIDPALLEYAGTGRLNLRVYPLPPNQDKRLMVAYTQSLAKLYDGYTLAIPLPEVDQPVGDMVVRARIAGCANCELSSPSHRIEVERSGDDAIVTYHQTRETIGDSFVVHVRDTRREPTVARYTEGGDRYLMVRAPAALDRTAREYRPRTWVILDDVSASRSALELRAQADLIDAFLRELDEQDKVAVVTFDVEARQKMAPTRVIDVDRRVVRAALADEGGVGATDIEKALAAALPLVANVDPDDAMIVYLGDGVITSGPRQLDVLRARLAGKAHFIGIGVGDGPDTETLGALAAATGGYATTFDLADDLGWRAFDLIAALHTSRVTGVTARLVDAAGQLVPATAYLRSPQLADGEQVELVAKLASDAIPAALELSGTRGGAPWHQRIELTTGASDEAAFLPRLWAHQHIAARLLAKHEPVVVPPCTATATTRTAAAVTCPTELQLRQQRDEEIRKEVVALGKQYFLLSRHTSLLVLEDDAMYARYGVRKGAGDTWAPYAMPAKLPVGATPSPASIPSDVADDAELVREPLQIFYSTGYADGWNEESEARFSASLDTVGLGRFGTIGHGSGIGAGYGMGWLRGRGDVADQTRLTLGLVNAQDKEPTVSAGERGSDVAGATAEPRAGFDPVERNAAPMESKRASVSTWEMQRGGGGFLDPRRLARRRANYHAASYRWYGAGPVQPARLRSPNETAFDDVTAFIPALVRDAADDWREQLHAGASGPIPSPGASSGSGARRTTPAIDDAARRLLAEARRRLPPGIYRWNGLEIAVDAARRFAWRRTTDAGLDETAVFDGTTLARRYPELGLSATRAAGDDAVALSLAYLPIWIADPAQYARWFEVRARGAHEVTLATRESGTPRIVLVLAFDDQARLISITDADGTKLVDVTWNASGPTAARVDGEPIAVGFTPDVIADATSWGPSTASAVVVELPTRVPGYWRARVDREQPGTPAWRHAQRQLMASLAALQDRPALYRAYDELREHGGVELGDLALASGGVATATTDKQLAAALAPVSIAGTPLAHYLVAGRAYGKAPRPARIAPQVQDGLVGALWTLRSVEAKVAAHQTRAAIDELVAMGNRALVLRVVGAWVATQPYDITAADVERAWHSVATGDYTNLARAQAAQTLYNHGTYDAAADQVAQLVSQLDLTAMPPQLAIASYAFTSSRRGAAGYQLVYATWRDRVLAGDSFAHVMALVPLASEHPGDIPALLARAGVLAGSGTARKLAVARTAIQYGQPALAQTIVDAQLKSSPSRELYQLAAQLALGQGRIADALALLERAQQAAAGEPVELSTVRAELAQILTVAQQLAMQSSGAAREQAVARALEWARRWRLIDPGNPDIDRQAGNMLLAVGDGAGAWRQLSSAIERDPWSGSGYTTVADAFERQGKVAEALPLWQQAIVIDQTDPTPRLRKAQALIALGRTQEGDALLAQITRRHWHDMWSGVVYQAKNLLARGTQAK